ncbi:MAG: putative rane spanning protein [Rhodospirillales bacterium]|nr:putative rane spanning protein [Rhodospirillales bacterium]
MKNFKLLSMALAFLGVTAATLLVGWFGFDRVASAMLSAGINGFALFCTWQIVVMMILGVAWRIVAPVTNGRPLAIFVWGRMVRDSAASCLPFSPVGGFVIGARWVTLHGISWPIAAISTVVDLTAEFAAEIIFALGGLMILLGRTSDEAVVRPAEIGLGIALVATVAVLRLQRGIAPLFVKLGKRLLGQWFGDAEPDGISAVELAARYGDGTRLALCTAVHVLGWFGKGLGNWIAFRLLGSDLDLMGALAIEGLLHIVMATAVLIPGYAGVQEAGYVGLGALFGVAPEIALGVSLLRRARDIAIGIPVLIIWQLIEVRRLRSVPAS